MTFELDKLGYESLEPFIDDETLGIHYNKHHQGYCDKLNKALESSPELFEKSGEDLLKDLDSIPKEIRSKVKNFGGGYVNHNFFWKCLSPNNKEANGKILDAINEKFGSFDEFKKQFSDSAATLFGSGWTWLVQTENGLEILNTYNQDSPLSVGKKPLLVIDVWEHAYYLKYKNKRPDFISGFWGFIDWDFVNKCYEESLL